MKGAVRDELDEAWTTEGAVEPPCDTVKVGRIPLRTRGFASPVGRSDSWLRLEGGRDAGAEDKAFIANDRAGGAFERAVGAAVRSGLSGADSLAAGGLPVFGAAEALAGADGADARAALISGMMVAFDAGLRLDV